MTFLKRLRARLGRASPAVDAHSAAPARVGAMSPVAPYAYRQRHEILADVRDCDTAAALGPYLAHHDGYVREAALERAAALGAVGLLPAITARLNDWVPAIRLRAREAMQALLPLCEPEAALSLLPALERLRAARRTDHAAWIGQVEHILAGLLGARRIVDGIGAPDPVIARACYRLAEEQDLGTSTERIGLALSNRADIVLSTRAAGALGTLDDPARTRMARHALRSHFGMVRAIALRALLERDVADGKTLAIDCLADAYGWTRRIAADWLGRHGVDAAALQAGRLAAPDSSAAVLRACLAGLAESGARDHVDTVRWLTSHPSARVRVAAFLAWLRLAPERKDDIARLVLESDAHRVRRLALSMTGRHGAYVPTRLALDLLRRHGDADADMLPALGAHDPWTWLESILERERQVRTDPAGRDGLARELAAWLRYGYTAATQPSAAQRALFKREETMRTLCGLRESSDARSAWPGLDVLRLL